MKKGFTLIAVVLDRSGSMESIRQATIDGFNEFLKAQRAAPGRALLTLAQFDHEYDLVFHMAPLPERHTAYFPRGSTALLDAIGNTIQRVGADLDGMPEAERPEKVIFVIITDGYENASHQFDRSKVFGMIKHQREKYAWDFQFLGANQDSIAEAGALGIAPQFAMNYAPTQGGTHAVYAASSAAALRSRAGGSSAFTPKEREENEAEIQKLADTVSVVAPTIKTTSPAGGRK